NILEIYSHTLHDALPIFGEGGQGLPELGEPVRERGVHLEYIPVGPQSAVPQQVAGVLIGEQVLAGRQRARVDLGHGGQRGVVQRDRKSTRLNSSHVKSSY